MAQPDPPRVIFHVDMDAFFAAIEQLEHPEWRGRPVIVGGVHSARGVVSTASYEARVFGVHSAMPVQEARRRCPDGIYVESRMEVYSRYSSRLMEICGEFSPVVEQISVDEAFLDMTGTAGLTGTPREAGLRLKNEITGRLGLTASVGSAPNKFLAKIASDLRKPDALVVVEPKDAVAFLDPLPVERLMGVGPRTAPSLHRLGLRTIGQVRALGREALEIALGTEFGAQLHALSMGEDAREIENGWREKSISHETTFEADNGDADHLEAVLLELCDRVARRARGQGISGRTVSLVWRDPDFTRHSRSRTFPEALQSSQILYETVRGLLHEIMAISAPVHRKFRLIGARLSGFGEEEQLSLFAPEEKKIGVDKAMDAVRARFGEASIARGRNTSKPAE